jgi:hypothetical protein
MVGLPWEEHVAFLDSRSIRCSIEDRVKTLVNASAGHPAIFAYAVGNEIPASIVRWHGRASVERFIEKLCGAVKSEDPTALVTYVNYPSTEYLALPAVDLFCFNVYLEQDAAFRSYMARLHNLAGDRPLLMGEIGLDSIRHGPIEQGRSVKRQVRAVSSSGCAGAFVFSWTDEWHRGGREISIGISASPPAIASPSLPSLRLAMLSRIFPLPLKPNSTCRVFPLSSALTMALATSANASRNFRASIIPTTKSSSSMTARPTAPRPSPVNLTSA